MKIQRKTFDLDLKAADDKGTWEAVIATLGVVDSDRDVVLPGAMTGQTAPIIPAHDSSKAPLGKTVVTEDGNEVIARGRFNLEVAAARDWFSAIKFDMDPENGPRKMEYSWGYLPTKYSHEDRDGVEVRLLERVDIMEVSPVLRGASVGTRTLAAKAEELTLGERVEAAAADVEKLIAELREISAGRKARGRKLGQAVRIGTLDVAKNWRSLTEELSALIADELLPEDAAQRAAARFLYSEASRHLK